jgi:hypothetical protein
LTTDFRDLARKMAEIRHFLRFSEARRRGRGARIAGNPRLFRSAAEDAKKPADRATGGLI